MNSKGTELTIFQGGPSIHVDNNQQRIEEEEALKDQIRRHGELNQELQGAFDDLEDDDPDESTNSTKYNQRNSYNFSRIPVHQMHHQKQNSFALRDEQTHQSNIIESKVREIEYVSNQLLKEREEHKKVVDEYEKQLLIAESEKERALMTRNETHQLLVENKSRSREIEEVNEELRSKIKTLERENSSLVEELESTKLMLSDVQIKYNMVEKNVIFNADRNTDLILREAKEKHSAQMEMMQQQVDGLRKKYEDLEHEHKNLDIRYKESIRSRETLLIEKGEIINQLNRNLENAQQQCQELLSRPNLSQENRHLQSIVRSIETEKNDLSLTINKLQKRLQEQTAEMELMDSIVQECGGNNNSFSEASKFINRDPLKSVNCSTPMAPEARLVRVKDELYKSLNNIKNKREEIKICEQQLREKDEEIKKLKFDENKALVKMNQYRDEMIRFESKTKILENELDKNRQELLQKSSDHTCITDEKYEEQIRNLQLLKENLEVELNSIKTDYERLRMRNGELMEFDKERQMKIEQLEAELLSLQRLSESADELNEERNKIKRLEEQLLKYQSIQRTDQATQGSLEGTRMSLFSNKAARGDRKACQTCEEYLLQLEKLEVSYEQMQNANDEHLENLERLKRELAESNNNVKALEEKLNLKEQRDQEIDNLKKKAEEFEEFIRTNTRSGSAASNKSNASDTKTFVSSDLEESSRKNREMETKIRDEMAKLFASEVKTLEKQFRVDTKELRNEIALLSQELTETTDQLMMRTEQLEVLKITILEERKEASRMLQEQEEDFRAVIEKYRSEHISKQQQIDELLSELNENKELMQEERLSIQALKRQINEERASLSQREEEMRSKYEKLQKESAKFIKELNEKYSSAKKTAMNYKQYSEDKENHFRSEYERTKTACLEAVEKLQKELKEREKKYHEKLKQKETEFDYKVEVLKGMLGNKP